MAQILVRDLDSVLVERLKQRAKRCGRSLQAEVRMILEESAKLDANTARDLLEEFSSRFKGSRFSESAHLIREDRDL